MNDAAKAMLRIFEAAGFEVEVNVVAGSHIELRAKGPDGNVHEVSGPKPFAAATELACRIGLMDRDFWERMSDPTKPGYREMADEL